MTDTKSGRRRLTLSLVKSDGLLYTEDIQDTRDDIPKPYEYYYVSRIAMERT